jgi:hypothetical protein
LQHFVACSDSNDSFLKIRFVAASLCDGGVASFNLMAVFIGLLVVVDSVVLLIKVPLSSLLRLQFPIAPLAVSHDIERVANLVALYKDNAFETLGAEV